MKTKRLADFGQDPTDNKNTDVTHTTAASIITKGLSYFNTSNSAPDLSDNESVTSQLKDKNENNDFAPVLKFLRGKNQQK